MSNDMKNDRSESRAEAAAAKARAKSMRPWYRKKRFILLGVIALIVVISVATSGGGDDDSDVASSGSTADNGVDSVQASGANKAENDVAIDTCAADDFGLVTADVTITNKSSKRSNYLIEMTIVDAGGTKIGDLIASSNNVDPGQVAKEQAVGSGPEDEAGFTCKLVSVTRYAS